MPKTQPKKTDTDSLLKRVKKDVDQWDKYARPYFSKWDEYWKLWNNIRVKQQFVGDFDSFDPMTFQMVESIVDNVYGSRPKLSFLPTDRYQETDTKILQGLWDYTWDENNMDALIIPWGREITITGNGALFCFWQDGCMKIVHKPIRDCIFDPRATCAEDMEYAGYKRLVMLDQLKDEKRFDPKTEKWVPKYSNLDDLETYGGTDSQTDKELKDMLHGSTLSDPVNQVLVHYLCYKDKIVEIANLTQIIFEDDNNFHKDAYKTDAQAQSHEGDKLYEENSLMPEAADMAAQGLLSQEDLAVTLDPTQTTVTVPAIEPFIPVVLQGEFKDAAMLLAKGDVEPFADSQEDLNDSINMMKEDIARNVRGVVITNKSVVQPDEEEELERAQPGSIVAITGGRANVDTLTHEAMDNAAQAEIARTKQSIRDTARVDEVIQGVSDATDKTATEIKTQVAQASSGFATKTRALESGAYRQLGDIFVKFNQIFLTEEQMVRILSKEGVEFKPFDPEKYWGNYETKVVLESNARAKKEADSRKALDWYSTVAKGNPNFNAVEVDKYISQKTFDIDEDDLKVLMAPDPNAMVPPGMPQPGMQSGAPVPPPQMPQPAGMMGA
jgi:hypothetical protein